MIIAIDYDDTYTRDPLMWKEFILMARKRGHNVYCVTSRDGTYDSEVQIDLEGIVEDIYFTNGKQKEKFMLDIGICVQVWIDDCPLSIVNKEMKESWE